MSEELLSSLSKDILEILLEKSAEDETERQFHARENGLPSESSWDQIGAEARRKTLLDQRKIIDGLRIYNLDLADKFERCFRDGSVFLQYLSESPENGFAKVAASTFLLDFKDLDDYCLALIARAGLDHLGPNAQAVEEFIQGMLGYTWGIYEQYGRLQNQFNNTEYILDRDQSLKSISLE